ncbi:hypothetical protein [Nitrospirillum sp. BR 11828]|uniref:hypothetical protein n=1 Tax=Nitrospirillum sp. BR 11828 TaxID=3104325 RepID=UPI002AC9F32F|nr:hypothetical protein [Nitrospirillum sp. BR 11828]MDZ5648346.1 hypothetical protein [Nitrospirillum sp. BR 11828]
MSASGSAPGSAATGSNNRITVIDALRGTALVGLFLLHTIEHFDFLSDAAVPRLG